MKYLGGKQRLGKHLSPVLHDLIIQYNLANETKLEYYLEPFCGSLGVLKNMTDLEMPIYASDFHPDLIALWKAVQEDSLIFPESVSEEEYNNAKMLESPSALKAFIGFGMSFGGRFFACYSDKHIGNSKANFCKEMRNSLNAKRPLITNVNFSCKDYKEWKPVNAIIYCDPPYKSHRDLVRYRKGTKKYDKFDTDEFWNVMREWSKNNLVLISEMVAPEDFEVVWSKSCRRSAGIAKDQNCEEKLWGLRPPITPK